MYSPREKDYNADELELVNAYADAVNSAGFNAFAFADVLAREGNSAIPAGAILGADTLSVQASNNSRVVARVKQESFLAKYALDVEIGRIAGRTCVIVRAPKYADTTPTPDAVRWLNKRAKLVEQLDASEYYNGAKIAGRMLSYR